MGDKNKSGSEFIPGDENESSDSEFSNISNIETRSEDGWSYISDPYTDM